MIEISENLFEKVYQEFKTRLESDSNIELVDFKTHPFIDVNENYKYGVLDNARENLRLRNWTADKIGDGRIIKSVKNSIQPTTTFKFKKYTNNLIDWRKKDDFKKLKPTIENEKLLFDFFKSKIKDENAFDRFNDIGFTYQLIAYLFFIKNAQKYMPISQVRFDKIFDYLNLNFQTSHNISWENYSTYIDILKSFKIHLSKIHENITLLDAHSFLWIYGSQYCYKEKDLTPAPSLHPASSKPSVKPKEPQISEMETYQPKKSLEIEEIPDEESEVDFIERHKKLMEIGAKAEDFVLKNEIEFLKSQGLQSLADKVRKVSFNPSLGCDILSFDISGKQKQIEVKAISTYKHSRSFIITRNELTKSKSYSNYWVYCVYDVESDEPQILKLKNPDFDNLDVFTIEPLTYRISFD